MAADANRLAAALDYLERIKRQAMDFGGGVASNLAERAKSAGGLAFEALTSDPNIGRMTTAEFSQAAADRQTPRLDQAAQDLGTIGRAIVTQPIQTGKAIVQGEIERAQGAMQSPRAAGEYAGSFIDPVRMAAALRKTGPVMAELDVYHGTPHRFPATEANPLGEFDASKIGTGEGAQAFGHGIYLAEKPTVAQDYQFMLSKIDPKTVTYQGKPAEKWYEMAQAEQDRAHRLRDQKAIDRANAKLAYWENVMTRRHPEDVKRVANDPDDGWPTFANYANSLDMSKFGGIGEAGSLYKADLPDEMVGRMLDWYKPLSEQPKAVREALKKSGLTSYVDEMEQSYFSQLSPAARALAQKMINGPDEMIVVSGKGLKNNKVAEKNWDELERLAPGIDHNRVHDIRDWYQSKSGADLYSEMSRNGVQDASERLRQMGIPGISYLDAGSRGATGAQTRNFVVFPGEEKKVRILERDGQKAPPQKIAQALETVKPEKAEPQPFGKWGYSTDQLRRTKQNFTSQYGLEEGKRFTKDYEVIELNKLRPTEKTDENKVQSLINAMVSEGNAKNTTIPPIIVDSMGNILDGHHRYEAAKRLEAKFVPVIELFDEEKGPMFAE